MIIYDEFTVQIEARNNLTKQEQREVRLMASAIMSDTRAYIEDELVPEHLKNKVKVTVS